MCGGSAAAPKKKFFFRNANCSKKFLNGKPFWKKLKLGDLNKETVVAGTQTHERGSVLLLVAQIHALDHWAITAWTFKAGYHHDFIWCIVIWCIGYIHKMYSDTFGNWKLLVS